MSGRRFQVIQGGKGGGAGATDGGPLLYKAHSLSNLTKGRAVFYDVRFNWYCLEREQTPIPYEDAIEDYGNLPPKLRSVLEREVNRFFTVEESLVLEEYLHHRYGMKLHTRKVSLPIRERMTFFEEGATVIYDFLDLSERAGYPLPFKVWGYYTLEGCLTSPLLEYGILYLEKALERLDLGEGVSRARLELVSRALYNEEGLFVQPREER